jgi:hypothetical protein
MKKQSLCYVSLCLFSSQALANSNTNNVSELSILPLMCIGLLGLYIARRKVKESEK